MATQRLVNTNFWKDTYVIDLTPTEKLLFLYFLTNPRTSLSGVYEISTREVAFDTGIPEVQVEKALVKFVADEKMYFERGWIVLRNFVRHQRFNESIRAGVYKSISLLPDWLQTVITVVETKTSMVLKVSDATSLGTDSPQYNLTKTKLTKTKANANYVELHAQIRRVYDFYIKTFGKNPAQLKLTDARKQKIKSRLREFSEEQLLSAITNASRDDFFNGGGKTGWVGNIDYLMRSTETVEKYATIENNDLTEGIKKYV